MRKNRVSLVHANMQLFSTKRKTFVGTKVDVKHEGCHRRAALFNCSVTESDLYTYILGKCKIIKVDRMFKEQETMVFSRPKNRDISIFLLTPNEEIMLVTTYNVSQKKNFSDTNNPTKCKNVTQLCT